MKVFFLLFTILFLQNCNKQKAILICGDHICVNKAEAKQYFEENLTLEVKIMNKKNKKNIDLVELNLKENIKGEKNINIFNKKITNKEIKTLSKDEIKKIKIKIKSKERINNKKIAKEENIKKDDKVLVSRKNDKILESKKNDKSIISEKKKLNFNNDIKKNVNKKTIDVVDVCTILEKCSIEEISKYLLKEGNKKEFPDITTRE
jgi:hypothetical protein